jgi:hypothetical protein
VQLLAARFAEIAQRIYGIMAQHVLRLKERLARPQGSRRRFIGRFSLQLRSKSEEDNARSCHIGEQGRQPALVAVEGIGIESRCLLDDLFYGFWRRSLSLASAPALA